jgi:hypothetical protein
MKEELEYRMIISYTNRPHITNTGKYLNRIRCKWENNMKK